jgi:hypothetical protein
MNTLKTAFARAALVLAFVASGCASVAPHQFDAATLMHDSSQGGGE